MLCIPVTLGTVVLWFHSVEDRMVESQILYRSADCIPVKLIINAVKFLRL